MHSGRLLTRDMHMGPCSAGSSVLRSPCRYTVTVACERIERTSTGKHAGNHAQQYSAPEVPVLRPNRGHDLPVSASGTGTQLGGTESSGYMGVSENRGS